MRTHLLALATLVALGVAAPAGAEDKKGDKKVENRVYEMRIYYTVPGRMDALQKRFRDHTCKLFEKHGMTIVGFWNPSDKDPKDPKKAENTLVYILSYPSRDAAKASWDAFRKDPDWNKARTESEKDGKIVDRIESMYLNPTDYSPMK